MAEDRSTASVTDSISSLPDVILQHILCFIPTKFAIRTSLLSRRWRHVWCDTPSLSFEKGALMAAAINNTLKRYTARKMTNFHLETWKRDDVPHINTWIEFAMSLNVENMSLDFGVEYKFPDDFYINYSVKQLTVDLHFADMIPRCSVSWTSLNKLSLRRCKLSDKSMAKILSACPILESLTLYECSKLMVLDLSKSLHLRTLEVKRNVWLPGPAQIVAPHVHSLRLRNSQKPSTLVDVSSLTEAKLNICFYLREESISAALLQAQVLKMLEMSRNVEKLTLGGIFLQILSLAELRGVPLPMFNVKTLTLETQIFQDVIPGIERLLQNSPDLKKLTVHTRNCRTIPGLYFENYLASHGLNPDQCWRSKDGVFWNKNICDVESKHVSSFMELMLKNTKRLEKMVVRLENDYIKFKDELVPTLSLNNNVSIVLST